MAMPVYFSILEDRGIRVLSLDLPAGIDASEFDRLNQRVLAEVESAAGEGWVLDLAACRYVGSAGLGFLINIRQMITAAGGLVVLCELSPAIEAVMRTSSVGRLFHVSATREAAIEHALTWRNRSDRRRGGRRR
jgi:anti-anti-sigma factor